MAGGLPGGYPSQAWHHMLQNPQSHHLVQIPIEVSCATMFVDGEICYARTWKVNRRSTKKNLKKF